MNNLIKTAVLLPVVFLFISTVFGGFLFIKSADAQYGSACSEYGIMAYEDYTGYCKCQSGYVFEESYLGTQCVSGDSVCSKEYGYGSDYDSYSGSCECRYGYVWGEDIFGDRQCITEDESCKNLLGYNARSTYGGQCECSYGYVIDGGQCVDGDRVCRSDHGLYSSYDSLSNKCECDSGYTFDDSYECVEKHNSAYFTLLDISEDGDELIVESQHNFQNYIIEFGIGCWDYAIESYEGNSLVINMGTDFSVDMFDTLVLPNHDQNCPIMGVDWTSDDSFPELEEEYNYYYTPSVPTYTPTYTAPTYTPQPVILNEEPAIIEAKDESDTYTKPPQFEISDFNSEVSTQTATTTPTEFSMENNEGITEGFISKIINFFKRLF